MNRKLIIWYSGVEFRKCCNGLRLNWLFSNIKFRLCSVYGAFYLLPEDYEQFIFDLPGISENNWLRFFLQDEVVYKIVNIGCFSDFFYIRKHRDQVFCTFGFDVKSCFKS